MVYDSPEQKQFIIAAVKSYPCTYQEALVLNSLYGKQIEEGLIAEPKEEEAQEIG